jgi:ABC-type Fe3+/spermidine/putrescine transport system ATPase subunit
LNTVKTLGLGKRFGDRVAVDGLDLEVAEGRIFGFLGPNGAGKTTVIRMLTGILRPTAGTATVLGYDLQHQSEQIKRNIGYVAQRFGVYENFDAPVQTVPTAPRKRVLQVPEERFQGQDQARPGSGPDPTRSPFEGGEDAQECIGFDPKGKVARSCSDSMLSRLLNQCEFTPLATAFPGTCSPVADPEGFRDCIEQVSSCRACKGFNEADALNAACDAIDDGFANGSCY